MTYTVTVDRAAQKEIRSLDRRIQRRIVDALKALAGDPFRRGVKKLANTENFYRYRVGDYRILYTVDGKRILVVIVGVRHRSKAYR